MKKVCSDVWTFAKVWKNAIFKQNYTPKLFINFKMAYSCCVGLGGNLDFPDFLQKKFYSIHYRCYIFFQVWKTPKCTKTTFKAIKISSLFEFKLNFIGLGNISEIEGLLFPGFGKYRCSMENWFFPSSDIMRALKNGAL